MQIIYITVTERHGPTWRAGWWMKIIDRQQKGVFKWVDIVVVVGLGGGGAGVGGEGEVDYS